MCPIFQATQIGTRQYVVKTITQAIIQTVHEKLQTLVSHEILPSTFFPFNDQKYGERKIDFSFLEKSAFFRRKIMRLIHTFEFLRQNYLRKNRIFYT